ncbi:hypothetical protein QQ045_031451 [Rhodiola kirilowii]
MGGVPSTPRSSQTQDTAEYLIGTFVGEKSFPLGSDFWQKLLELPLNLSWPSDRVEDACQLFAKNNYYTRHLSKILIHLALCLQESISVSGSSSSVNVKALNAVYLSRVFLKFLIEHAKNEMLEELYLSLEENEAIPNKLSGDYKIENLVMRNVLNFIGTIDISPNTYVLHHELLDFLLVTMSTQLLAGPSPGSEDVNPFIDAVMGQDPSLVCQIVNRLLDNYIIRPHIPLNNATHSVFNGGSEHGVLQRFSSAAANLMLLPLTYLVSSNGDGSRSSLADISIYLLLILIHYRKRIVADETDRSEDNASFDPMFKQATHFSENPFCKALENARDIEFDRADIEGTAHNGPLVRLPFASLFDTLGMCLSDEASVLLLYSLVHGNSDFLEYVLVRTDLDTLMMPILETLYNASKSTPNHIYMLLIILLILSQDSSFNASIHKLILPTVPWYQERRLHQTSLGSLVVIILIRTVQYNLSKLRDVYLHTNCLATLANMAPHAHRLSAYASQRLVSLFDMLSRKYTKLSQLRDEKYNSGKGNFTEDSITDNMSVELNIYTDFLRIVLEIINAILTYALPRNPEVVYAIMHRQEVFLPFRKHPRFDELIDNIYTVLDFFNSRMDAHSMNGEWSVEKVLQVIITNCRSWRGDGMKMFTQLRFTYEQESHPEEFFIPYVWKLALSGCNFSFNPNMITLFPLDQPAENNDEEDGIEQHQPVDPSVPGIFLDP